MTLELWQIFITVPALLLLEGFYSGAEMALLAADKIRLKNLEKTPRGSLMISAADKIHNMRSIVEEYTGNEAQYIKDFSADPSQHIEMYQKLKFLLNAQLQSDIMNEYNHVFSQYISFLNDAQKIYEPR